MAGKTPREAVSNFISPLQQAISCITDSVIQHLGGYAENISYALVVGNGQPVPLQSPGRVSLTVGMQYSIVRASGDIGPYKVHTTQYIYALDDQNGQEIIAYHWQPDGKFRFPHIHLGAGSRVGHNMLRKCHLPTGRVALEQIIRLTITEFGVEAIRSDWRKILTNAQKTFEDYRTWPRPK